LPRPAFTLVELLVVVSVILILMGMIGAAVSGARGSQRKQATQALIAKIDGVIQQHLSSYASRVVPGATSAADRLKNLRELARCELPESWNRVKGLASGTAAFAFTTPQRAYVRYEDELKPSPTHESAECLFMIVMVGGIADCLDCDSLGASQKDDTDGDRAPEFLDAWGQPIRFVPGPDFRPLIYSGGPARLVGPPVMNDGSNVSQGFITNFDADLTK
jgi:prepilin-type N-terminal cleavage/methylation domain-containing protein